MVPRPQRNESITNPLPNAEGLVRFRPSAMTEKSNRRAFSNATKKSMCTGVRPLYLGEKENDDSDSSFYESGEMTPPPVYEKSPEYEETCSIPSGKGL